MKFQATLAASLLAAPCLGAAEPAVSSTTTLPGAYIVEFVDNQNVKDFKVQADSQFETRMEYDSELFKGASIQLQGNNTAEEEAEILANIPSVKNIWPVQVVSRPKPIIRGGDSRGGGKNSSAFAGHIGKREGGAYSPHVMTQVDKMHARNITGKGFKIAVVDTGVDWSHPALGGCFGEGCLVSGGWDFVGDDYFPGQNEPVPDGDPMDCDGHGSHVAGIIAARENELGFRGAAPGVSLAAYRVFSCVGDVTEDILVASFLRAYEEGADIITASLGYKSGWSSHPVSVAIDRIAAKGVPCIFSAMNTGANGLFDTGVPATGELTTAVASFDNTLEPRYLQKGFYTIDEVEKEVPLLYGGPFDWDGEKHPLWAARLSSNGSIGACEPLPDSTPDLSNYYALVVGDCDVKVEVRNLVAKGARVVIHIRRGRWPEYPDIWDVENLEGVAMVAEDTADVWIKALSRGTDVEVRLPTWDDVEEAIIAFPNTATGGAVSDFSSWGPTFEMTAKPQFGAPGGDIISTVLGGYDVFSGTSMACPFVAASFALVAEARGGKPDFALIRDLLASTSKAQVYVADETRGWERKEWLAPAPQQGAGLIQVYDAAFGTTIVQPSNVNFRDAGHFEETLNFTIKNTDDKEVTYEISHVPTHTLFTLEEDGLSRPHWTDFHDDSEAHATLDFSTSKLTIAAGASATVQVTATPPQGIQNNRYPVWSGYITINGTDGTALSLPYQGLSSSLAKVTPVLDDGVFMADVNSWPDDPAPANATFVLPAPGDDWGLTPRWHIDLQWGTPVYEIHLISANGESPLEGPVVRGRKTVGKLVESRWAGRYVFGGQFDGSVEGGEYAPAGSYKVLASVLRIEGDETKDEDWVMAESPVFNIVYEGSE